MLHVAAVLENSAFRIRYSFRLDVLEQSFSHSSSFGINLFKTVLFFRHDLLSFREVVHQILLHLLLMYFFMGFNDSFVRN